MSKSHREIKLKPIEFPKITEATNRNDADQKETQLAILDQKINVAKTQLKQIDQTIETKRRQTEEQISQAREDWQIEKAKLIEQTTQSAYDEGFLKGQNEGYQAVSEKIEQASQLIETAREQQLKIINQSEGTILELATNIARKIVTYEITENNRFIELVKTAIQEIHNQPSIKIYTSFDDFEQISNQHDQLMTLVDPEIVLTVHPSDEMKQGDCIIKTPYSKLDVSVDLQLKKIKTRLIEVMEEIKREHQ